jgi:hypothetical protein
VVVDYSGTGIVVETLPGSFCTALAHTGRSRTILAAGQPHGNLSAESDTRKFRRHFLLIAITAFPCTTHVARWLLWGDLPPVGRQLPDKW